MPPHIRRSLSVSAQGSLPWPMLVPGGKHALQWQGLTPGVPPSSKDIQRLVADTLRVESQGRGRHQEGGVPAAAPLGMGVGLVSSGDLIKGPLFHAPLAHRGLAPDMGLGPRSFSTWSVGINRRGGGVSTAEGVVVAGLVTFWLGFCVAALVSEMERTRLEAELARERESAAFLAHVTALEWNRKQEAEREKVLAERDSGIELWKEPSLGGNRGACPGLGSQAEDPLAGTFSGREKLSRRSPAGGSLRHGLPSLGSDGFNRSSGEEAEGAATEGLGATRKALDFAPVPEEGGPKGPRSPGVQGEGKEASVGAGVPGDQEMSKEVKEYVQGLERELDGAYADLDMALAELDGTKGELDEVLAELEACRADLEGLDMTRHKVKTLRVCLEIAKQSQRKAAGQAEGMKRELRKAESLLSHSSKEMRKLKQENASMRTALGALFLNLTMAVRATPPHNAVHPPPSPRIAPQSSPRAAPLVRPPSPLPPLRKGTLSEDA